jgi:pyruvate kinase
VEAESTKQRGSIVERAPHNSDAMRIINEAKADDVEAIVISTETEELPAAISALRPNMPIIVCSNNAKILRLLQLRFAIYPVAGSDVSGAKKWLKAGTKVVTASTENPAPSLVTL